MKFSIDKMSFRHPNKDDLALILTWFNKPHVQEFFDDPEVRNTKEIHVYEKAGFVKVEEFCPEPGRFAAGIPHVLMKLNIYST